VKASDMPRKPNIVVFISDDTDEAGMLGYGGAPVLTPNIDSIAANGVRFTQFHCASTVCTPSRYNYLSGHYGGRCPSQDLWKGSEPGEAYCLGFNTHIESDKEKSLGSALQSAGYTTGYVGKWHVGPGHHELGDGIQIAADADPDDLDVLDRMKLQQERFSDVVASNGFDYASHLIWGNHEHLPKKARVHNLEWICKGAVDFIDEQAGGEEPFFLYVATTTMHGPDHASSLFGDIRRTAGGISEDHLGLMPARATIYERLRMAGLPFNHITTGALWMDDLVGTVVERLRELGIHEDTLVAFSTDHGTIGGKFSPYQEGTHLPFAMQWPGHIPAGSVYEGLAQNVDLLPTLMDCAGAAAPEDMALDGLSLLPHVVEGGVDAPEHEDLYFEIGYTRGVRTKRWKYVAWRPPQRLVDDLKSGRVESLYDHWGKVLGYEVERPTAKSIHRPRYPHYFAPDQLYDLENDPEEKVNLVGEPAHASVLAEMRERLGKYLSTFDAPFDLEAVDPFLLSEAYAQRAARMGGRFLEEVELWWENDGAFSGFPEMLGTPRGRNLRKEEQC
jgi:arylsulfatase A-like enzyme